jgi:nucleoid-associated protein YgaU
VGGGWNAIYQRNKAVIGPDPDKIKPGMVLTLP